MNALRRIHAALVPSGIVIDTQPVSARPLVTAGDGELGTLDMREWARTIEAVDRLVEETVEGGLFALDRERRFTVADTFDNGADFVAEVRGWAGTQIPAPLAERAAAARPPLRVRQEVRLRELRALPLK